MLVSGPNFGCGSSREHAVWALQDYGFQAVVAPSFADIFRGNAISSGLVPAQVTEQAAARLADALAAAPDAEVVVDVAARTISAGDVTEPFELADYPQWRLLEGLDDIGLALRHEDEIAAFEERRGLASGRYGRPAGWLRRPDSVKVPQARRGYLSRRHLFGRLPACLLQ